MARMVQSKIDGRRRDMYATMKSIRIRRANDRAERLAAAASEKITMTPDEYDTEWILCERAKDPLPQTNRFPTLRGRALCKWYAQVTPTIGWISVKGRQATWTTGRFSALIVNGKERNYDNIEGLTHFEENLTVEGYIAGTQFYAHSITAPQPYSELNFEQQLAFLKLNGFSVADHGLFSRGSLEQVEDYLTAKQLKLSAHALIVGSASRADKAIFYATRFNGVTTVKAVDWLPDHCGNLIPRIEVEPIVIHNWEVRHVSGHNARFIVDEGIGPSAIVRIRCVENIAPIVESVIGCVDASLPAEINYKWQDQHIVAIDNKQLE